MTARGWLQARQPRPPAALAARIEALVVDRPQEDIPESLVSAAAATLHTLLRLKATDRTGALGLLAADALATYAFEAAADEPETLEWRATDALRRLSTIPTDL